MAWNLFIWAATNPTVPLGFLGTIGLTWACLERVLLGDELTASENVDEDEDVDDVSNMVLVKWSLFGLNPILAILTVGVSSIEFDGLLNTADVALPSIGYGAVESVDCCNVSSENKAFILKPIGGARFGIFGGGWLGFSIGVGNGDEVDKSVDELLKLWSLAVFNKKLSIYFSS